MYLREALLQAGAEIKEILKRQIGMQPSDDMKLRDRFTVSSACRFKRLLERHGVGSGRIFLAAEGTEATGRDAHVRGIDVAIDIEVGLVAMQPLADMIGHPSHGEHIAGAIEGERIGGIEALTGHHLGMNRMQPGIVSLKRMALGRRKHPFDDIAGARQKSQKQGINGLP